MIVVMMTLNVRLCACSTLLRHLQKVDKVRLQFPLRSSS